MYLNSSYEKYTGDINQYLEANGDGILISKKNSYKGKFKDGYLCGEGEEILNSKRNKIYEGQYSYNFHHG